MELITLGLCLNNHTFLPDSRDQIKQERFFPLGIDIHFLAKEDTEFWYSKYNFYKVAQGNLSCCSDTFVSAHYVTPAAMYFMEYLIYHVHPFGIEKNLTESRPRKFTKNEIFELSHLKKMPQYIDAIKNPADIISETLTTSNNNSIA